MPDSVSSVQELATHLRVDALRMVHQARASHIGSCLSIAELLAVLYRRVLRIDPRRPDWPERDRFVLSKGHAAAILYAVLAECGFFPLDWLETYCGDDSLLMGHVSHGVPGVEVSTGSLGHGLSIACGMALAAQRLGSDRRVVVLLGDGELDEGSCWEAIMFAAQHRLKNLVAIVDYNKIQGLGAVNEVLDLEPLAEKWRSFRWAAMEIDGHDVKQIERALAPPPTGCSSPTALIAHTVKGKGVSFMENELAWHYRCPDDKELNLALAELGASR